MSRASPHSDSRHGAAPPVRPPATLRIADPAEALTLARVRIEGRDEVLLITSYDDGEARGVVVPRAAEVTPWDAVAAFAMSGYDGLRRLLAGEVPEVTVPVDSLQMPLLTGEQVPADLPEGVGRDGLRAGEGHGLAAYAAEGEPPCLDPVRRRVGALGCLGRARGSRRRGESCGARPRTRVLPAYGRDPHRVSDEEHVVRDSTCRDGYTRPPRMAAAASDARGPRVRPSTLTHSRRRRNAATNVPNWLRGSTLPSPSHRSLGHLQRYVDRIVAG